MVWSFSLSSQSSYVQCTYISPASHRTNTSHDMADINLIKNNKRNFRNFLSIIHLLVGLAWSLVIYVYAILWYHSLSELYYTRFAPLLCRSRKCSSASRNICFNNAIKSNLPLSLIILLISLWRDLPLLSCCSSGCTVHCPFSVEPIREKMELPPPVCRRHNCLSLVA